MTTYIQAIGWGFPNVQCHAVGDGSIYESTLVGNANRPPRNLGISKQVASKPARSGSRERFIGVNPR